jgi:hypothetical protein
MTRRVYWRLESTGNKFFCPRHFAKLLQTQPEAKYQFMKERMEHYNNETLCLNCQSEEFMGGQYKTYGNPASPEKRAQSKAVLMEAFRKDPFRHIRIDDTVQVFNLSMTAHVHKIADKALRSGSTVVWEDGRTEWIERHVHHDPTKEGSAAYIWDKSNNKVKADIILKTKSRTGEITHRTLGTRFVEFE